MRSRPDPTDEGRLNAPGTDERERPDDGPDETPIDFQPESGAVPHDPPSDEQAERDPRDDI